MTKRVDDIIALSDAIYTALRPTEHDPNPSQRLLNESMQMTVQALGRHGNVEITGLAFYTFIKTELDKLGVRPEVYKPWHIPEIAELKISPDANRYSAIDELTLLYGSIERGTRALNGAKETNAMHVIHLAAVAIPYAQTIYPELPIGKTALDILIHDLPEAYAGDTVTLNIGAAEEAQKRYKEEQAIEKLQHKFGTQHPLLLDTLLEYEKLATPHTRLVKTFDKLDPSFSHLCNKGFALVHDHHIASSAEFRQAIQKTEQRMQAYCQEFPEVMTDRTELLDRIIATTWP